MEIGSSFELVQHFSKQPRSLRDNLLMVAHRTKFHASQQNDYTNALCPLLA